MIRDDFTKHQNTNKHNKCYKWTHSCPRTCPFSCSLSQTPASSWPFSGDPSPCSSPASSENMEEKQMLGAIYMSQFIIHNRINTYHLLVECLSQTQLLSFINVKFITAV